MTDSLNFYRASSSVGIYLVAEGECCFIMHSLKTKDASLARSCRLLSFFQSSSYQWFHIAAAMQHNCYGVSLHCNSNYAHNYVFKARNPSTIWTP